MDVDELKFKRFSFKVFWAMSRDQYRSIINFKDWSDNFIFEEHNFSLIDKRLSGVAVENALMD